MATDNERAVGPASMPTTVSLNTEQPSTTNYTIPGILHFIKHEWSRFEKERANWEVERAELQVTSHTHSLNTFALLSSVVCVCVVSLNPGCVWHHTCLA